jgi:TusA-related sulfurtransferase
MPEETAAGQFLEGLAGRDFARLAASLTAEVRARMLLPRGAEEHMGREAVVGRFQAWFGSASEFGVQLSSAESLGGRHRVSYRLNVVRDGRTRELIEQVAFLDVNDHGIDRIDLLCSGFQAESVEPAAPLQVFDAGGMGCSDGLAQEFRRRIAGVPVNGSLNVVVSDPAAKEDLPALARLMGHRVSSIRAMDDGRLTITVEKQT